MLFILNSFSLRPGILWKDSRQQFLSYQNIHIEDHHFIKQQMPLVQIVQRQNHRFFFIHFCALIIEIMSM
ncbi:hypothetical protein [Cytobacillus firmus]|uniref:hypothetical protein n=1 Tax=Cytobacillus firmus TaxID=1399 RepID=UPI002E1BF1F4|nr:hypothetical protein [Cytobacillus firmus]MED1906831.1 hypothetical protein [Cytobacillus firmus]